MGKLFAGEETLTVLGMAVFVVIIAALLLLIMVIGKPKDAKRGADVKAMTISALLIAMAMVLSQIRLFSMPQGGGVTLMSMLPIALCAYMLGTRRGVMAGIALGIVNLIFNPYVIHPAQLLVDYPLAFGALGVGGICRNRKHGLIKGYLLGIFGRYICSVISGIVFFGAYAPENFNAVTWSLWYNFTYIAAEGLITVILLIPTEKTFNRLSTQLQNA